MNIVIDSLKDFFGNYILVSALTGWFLAQIIKIFICLFSREKINVFKMLFSNGGMPSSHSSTVMALCTACGIKEGLSSSVFAVSLIFAAIVMIDASGVRYQAGKQAQIINKIVKEIFSGKVEDFNTGLKELIGHTPFQVLMGALLGIAIAVVYSFIIL